MIFEHPARKVTFAAPEKSASLAIWQTKKDK
jgi:hypothetical protein